MKETRRLGCQTRPWIARGASVREAVQGVARAGYEGVEVGYKLLAGMTSAELARLLEAEGLVLAGVHLALPWHDLADADVEDAVGPLLGLVETLGAWVIASGQRDLATRGPEGWDAANRVLRRVHERVAERGLRLCYHNHGWELGVPDLFERLTEGLPLAVDVAHLARAGVELLPWFRGHAERIEYLHLRDVNGGAWAPALGRGTLPLSECLELARRARWLVVETEPDPLHPELFDRWAPKLDDYLAESAQYLEGWRRSGARNAPGCSAG